MMIGYVIFPEQNSSKIVQSKLIFVWFGETSKLVIDWLFYLQGLLICIRTQQIPLHMIQRFIFKIFKSGLQITYETENAN